MLLCAIDTETFIICFSMKDAMDHDAMIDRLLLTIERLLWAHLRKISIHRYCCLLLIYTVVLVGVCSSCLRFNLVAKEIFTVP